MFAKSTSILFRRNTAVKMTKEKSTFLKYCTQHKTKWYFLFVFFFVESVLYYISNQCAILTQKQVMIFGSKTLMTRDHEMEIPQINKHTEIIKSIHNYSNSRSDMLDMTGDIRIHANSGTIYVDLNMNRSWTVKTYARKYLKLKIDWNIQASKNTTEFPVCRKNYSTPAILFSYGSFAGNFYHAFADMLLPLYITSRPFNGSVLLLMSDWQPWWIGKYKMILEKLTNYEIMDIDKEIEVFCFSRLIVGLKADKELLSDSNVYSINNFRQLLRETYSLERKTTSDCNNKKCGTKVPRVLIISRKNNRRLINGEEIAEMARNLGAEVSLTEVDWDMSTNAGYVNSFDVLIGVHGAGLTNILFLPENAVLVQIVPLSLEYVSRMYYGEPAVEMKLRNLEYMVSVNESSLCGKYPPDSEIYKNPYAIYLKGGYALSKSIYMDNQDVTLDLVRFKATLLKALDLVQYNRKPKKNVP